MLDVPNQLGTPPQVRASEVAPSRLSLTFSGDGDGRTYLDRQFASYPFHVCRPHYFPHDAPGMATLYVQSSAGGLYQEDAHDIEIVAKDDARAHITTQASTIVHSMERGGATQRTSIVVGPGCHVEAVPDALILFPDARLSTGLTVRVHDSATAIVGESFLMHDPDAAGSDTDVRSFASYEAKTVVEDWHGVRLAADRFRISGRDVLAATPGITGGTRAQGLFMVLQRGKDLSPLIESLRAGLAQQDDVLAGISEMPNDAGAWVRMLAPDGAALRAGMLAAWASASETLTGVRPPPRRK